MGVPRLLSNTEGTLKVGIKTIALVVFDSAEAEWVINQTVTLASSLGAHVLGLHTYAPAVFLAGMAAEPMVFPTYRDWETDESDQVQTLLEQAARNNDVQAEFRRQTLLYGAEAFALSSVRAADLVVMGTNGSKTRSPDNRALASQIVRHAGRPVLVLNPESGLSRQAETIVVGWSDTRESTRAAHDALLLAKPGASIRVVSLMSRPGEEQQGLGSHKDFAAALDRLGFEAVVIERMATAESRAEELLRIATEEGADLLVTGAFGHSQVYDFVVGAVTRHLLESARLPVLLSK